MTFDGGATPALGTKKSSDAGNGMESIWGSQSCEVTGAFEVASFCSGTLPLTSLKKLRVNILGATFLELKLKLSKLESWADRIAISDSKALSSIP